MVDKQLTVRAVGGTKAHDEALIVVSADWEDKEETVKLGSAVQKWHLTPNPNPSDWLGGLNPPPLQKTKKSCSLLTALSQQLNTPRNVQVLMV